METHKFIVDLMAELIRGWQKEVGENLKEDCTLEVVEWMQHMSNKHPWPDFYPSIPESVKNNIFKDDCLYMAVEAYFQYENTMRALQLNDFFEYSASLAIASKSAETYKILKLLKFVMDELDEVGETAEVIDRVMLGRIKGGENSQGLDFEERAKRDQLIIQEYKRLSEAAKRKSKNEISNILARKLNPKFRELFPDLERNYSAKTYLRTLKKENFL